MQLLRLRTIFLLTCICSTISSLKCRSDDGPSDEDLKRVARSCMQKISETGDRYSSNQNNSSSSDNFRDWEYEEHNRDDRFRQGNRDRLHMRSSRSRRSPTDRKFDYSLLSGRDQHPNQRSGNKNHDGGLGKDNNNSHGDRQSHDRAHDMQRDQDGACVVHCFFDELNMLNNNDYPDKHKVMYILTKDIRDRELRSFYTDTIQECFHHLDTQRRKDRCQFSKELINCMMEYAQANCDDWQDHTLIFT